MTRSRRLRLLLLVMGLYGSCAPVPLVFGSDAGADAGFDAGLDAGSDAGADGGPPDAGPCGGCGQVSGLQCDAVNRRCVQCLSAGDCAAPRPACDPSGRCVECNLATDCSGTNPGCDAVTHRCGRACQGSIDCTAPGDEGCGAAMLCRRCDDNSECSSSDAGRKCDTRLGRCVECSRNLDCPALSPLCDVSRGQCVRCLQASDCDAGQVCDPALWRCAP
ncbi:MAG: hypothetical protein IPJ65_40030 [Archangiaceae bacterium]|nr:hypothetical protein [Archangiaceae bacterium]